MATAPAPAVTITVSIPPASDPGAFFADLQSRLAAAISRAS